MEENVLFQILLNISDRLFEGIESARRAASEITENTAAIFIDENIFHSAKVNKT